jgi:hypothetical protein
MMPDECFSECVRVLTHEFNHWAIYEATGDAQIMSDYDRLDYAKLEAWLKE